MTLTDDEKDVAIRSALAQLPLGHTVWDGHRASYDAGLAAIPREPTQAMIDAGALQMFAEGSDFKRRELLLIARKGWRAMYDAARKP